MQTGFDKPRARTEDWTRPGIQSKDWVQHGFDTPRAWTEDLGLLGPAWTFYMYPRY